MTGFDPGQGPPESEERAATNGPPSTLSTPIKNNPYGTPRSDQPHSVPPVPTAADLATLYPLPPSVGCASCQYGLTFEDGRRSCRRHFTADDRTMLAELDQRAWGLGFKRSGDYDRTNELSYPYGPNADVAMRRVMIEWAEARQLRFEDRSHLCPSWVGGQRCPGVRRCSGQSIRALLGHLDHGTSWTGPAGLRLIVAQPYSVSSYDAPALEALNGSASLHVVVTPPGSSWYGHGTWMIAIAGFPSDAEAAA